MAAASPIGLITALLLLWLAGNALRLTILAVPPVMPQIHLDLALSKTQVGILAGIPMVLFAGAAIAGSLLIARFGAINTLIAGLVLCALGGAVRGVGPDIAMLYFGTIVTAFGVGVMQPSMPPLVRAWVPQHRIGFATAVYSNGLIIGEILPAALTIPFVLPWLNQSWQWTLVFWSAPVLGIAAVVWWFTPRATPVATATLVSRDWMPDFRNPVIWRVGILLGSVNASYFALNGFLPDYLTHTGRPDLINAALTALNAGQLPASILLLAWADRMIRTVWSYVFCGVVNLLCVGAIMLGGVWVVIGSAIWGCCGAAVLVLVLALPPLISAPGEVHRVSAGVFAISYSCAVIVPIIGGALWDLTGWTIAPLIPMAIYMLVVIGLAPSVALRDKSA